MSVSKFFKAYDLRGTTPELTRDVYYWTGFALVSEILKPQNLPQKVLIMRDCRLSSPEFYEAFSLGIIRAGGNPIRLGIGTTDALYAASICQNLPGAIITASHNPKDDNGLKIVKEIPQMLGLSTGLSLIRDFVAQKMEREKAVIDWENLGKLGENNEKNSQNLESDFQGNSQNNLTENLENAGQNSGENTQIKTEVMGFFVDKIKEIGQVSQTLENLQILQKKSKTMLKIVVDTANGMGGFIMPFLQKIYGEMVDFVPLFWELDGSFPNHPADPMSEENLVFLKKKIRETGADFGVAMDGDADRAFFVDESGELINGEYIVPLFAQNLLEKYFTEKVESEQDLEKNNSGKLEENQEKTKNSILNLEPAIVFPISYSRNTGETVLANNGVPITSLQGHTFIKEKMKKYGAIYGGEASGHHYFGQFSFMDSGAVSIALFIKIWAEENLEKDTKASQICQFWHNYFVSGEHNFKLPESLNMPKVKAIIHKNFPRELGFIISELDGITVYHQDFKFTIRGSNTEPLLRINTEYKGQNRAMEVLAKIKNLLGIE